MFVNIERGGLGDNFDTKISRLNAQTSLKSDTTSWRATLTSIRMEIERIPERKGKSLSSEYENQISWIEINDIEDLASILANYEAVIEILQRMHKNRQYDGFALFCISCITVALRYLGYGKEK